jgi:NADPH:quinone reductase-like Zn-dependent oxidoreductase
MAKNLRVQGLTVGNRAQQLDMIRFIDKNGIKPVLDRSFPLAGLADAFRYQATGAHFGKIVIEI